jgi:hypothetical protein
VFVECDAGGDHGGTQGSTQFARVEACLFQQPVVVMCYPETGDQTAGFVRRQRNTLGRSVCRIDSLHGLLRSEGDVAPRKLLYYLQKLAVKTSTVTRKWQQRRRIFGVFDG